MKNIIKRCITLVLVMSFIICSSTEVHAANEKSQKTIYTSVTSAAILEDGSLYTWGQNDYGNVGNGTSGGEQLTPVRILSKAKTVCFGNFYGGAITEDGSLYMWGYNQYGQIGNGQIETNQLTPVKVLSNVVSVQLNTLHSAAITEDGSLYMWGWNEDGQIGNGTTARSQALPVKILSNVVSVNVGSSHSAAITEDGSLYMWGANYAGQIGNGETETNQLTPVKVLSDVISVELGSSYTAAITKDGSLYMWGVNEYGQIGNGTKTRQPIPQKVLSAVESVSVGSDCSAAITNDGSLYMWGHGLDGRLGNGQKDWGECQVTPVKILSNVTTVSLGTSNGAAITETGDLYVWGNNSDGQIGNGTEDWSKPQLTPRKVLSNVADVCMSYACLALRNDGSLYAWGNNFNGQVGNGTTANQLTPMKILNGVRLPEKEEINNTNVMRLYGHTRYETSCVIADALKAQLNVEQFDIVILTDGRNFPDALAGSYLAGKLNAPILMANETPQYAESLQEYICNNLKSGGTVYVLGGTGAVPDSVLNGLSDYHIKRLSGSSRYETNLRILEEAGVENEEILVCTGKTFADSLSASATGRPILLVNNEELTDLQKAFLEEHTENEYYIIGGEGAVSGSIEAEIQNYGMQTNRISGTSRYETSVKVAEKFFENPKAAVLAYAENFPDGLCGGPLAMSMDAPLILAATGKTDAAAAYVKANAIEAGRILGGDSLISNRAVNKIF